MKISKISIKNYRSCINTTFEPNSQLSALIGPNGSGKTTVLSAIRLLSSLCLRGGRFASGELDAEAPISEIKTWYDINGKKLVHTAKFNLVTNEKNQDEIIATEEQWNTYGINGSRKKIDVASWIIMDLAVRMNSLNTEISNRRVNAYLDSRGLDSRDFEILVQVVKTISEINYYSASQFTNPANCPISFEVEGDNTRRTGISISGHKKFLFDMYQEWRAKSEAYRQFIDIVGPSSIGLIEKIEFKEIVTSSFNYSVLTGGDVRTSEKNNRLIIPSFRISNNRLSPSQLSEGTFKTLALIFYLVTDKSSILLLEEPEVCVHHGLLSSIVELIKVYSKEKQIIVSTHSDSVLDRLALENVFTVRRTANEGTHVSNIRKKLGTIELRALRNYLTNEGSLGEFWKHGDLENA